MLEAEASNYVICCGTYARPDIEEMGLVEGHAYTVVTLFLFSSVYFRNRVDW